MIGIFVLIGIAILVAISSFISSTGKLLDKRKHGINCVTKRGWVIIFLNFGIIILSVLQYFFNQKELVRESIAATNKQTKRDSILKSNYDSSLYVLKKKFDTSNLVTVLTISQTLGKYGYLFDSAQRRIIKIIKDSSKTTIIAQEDPILSICSFDGIKLTKKENGLNNFDLTFCFMGAGCTGFKLKASIVLSDSMPSNNFFYLMNIIPLANELQMPKDAEYVHHFYFSDDIKFNLLYVHVVGTYSNIDRSKNFKMNSVYFYNKTNKTTGMVSGLTRSKIIACIEKNKD